MSKLSKAHKAFIVESAMDYLGVSDRNPEVGMGMFAFTAVDLAVAEFKETAELFGPVIDVSQAEKDEIEEEVVRLRTWPNGAH